jgi:uncharacterized protein (DUF3084 family)
MSDAPLTEKELLEKIEKATEKAKKSVVLAAKIDKSRAAVAARYEKIQERERKVAAALDKLNARHETAMKKLTRAQARAAKLSGEAKATDSDKGSTGV